MRIQPVGKGLSFTIVLSIWAVLSTLTIALRIWARYIIRAFGLDDYLMILAYVMFVSVLICDFMSINFGVGAHAYRLTEYDSKEAKKWFVFAGIGYAVATALVKISICVLLMRVTRGTKRIFTIILYSVIVLACVGSFVRVIAYVTRCKPFSATWDAKVAAASSCSSPYILSDVTWFFSAVCISTDWVCATLPIFIIWQLQLPLRTKIQLAFILALGALASIATIIRMKHLIDYTRTNDFLYSLMDVGLWSETEACLGIIAGSLPTMRPLLRYIPCLSASHRTRSETDVAPPYKLHHLSPRKRSGSYGTEKCENIEPTTSYMGHSFQISTARGRDLERGEGEDAASQKGILSEVRLDIVKETEFEVHSESSGSQRARSSDEEMVKEALRKPRTDEFQLRNAI